MNYLIDYLTFSVVPDKNIDKSHIVIIAELFGLLGLMDYARDFYGNNLGYKRFYDYCYEYNGISLYGSFKERISEQGFGVELKGSGCRFYEYVHNNNDECWYNLFVGLLGLVKKGCKVNITRLDFAFDDKCKDGERLILSLDDVIACADKDGDIFTFVSRSSTSKVISERCKIKKFDKESKRFIDVSVLGQTVYFGSRSSDFSCKFYDKFVEQSLLNKNNLYELRNLADITHWVRFEVTFKNLHAIRIVNAFVRLYKSGIFGDFLAQTINGFIRFVKVDNVRKERCSIVPWWFDFLGTMSYVKLKVKGLKKSEFVSACNWLNRSVSQIARAVIENVGLDVFLGLLYDGSDPARFSEKHWRIANDKLPKDIIYTNNDLWQANIPQVVVDFEKMSLQKVYN